MSEPARDKVYLNQEVIGYLERLGPEDHRRLARLAEVRARKVPDLIGSELLNEAIARILEGTRPWKKSVDFTAFVCEVMRSIASEYLGKFKTRKKHAINYENELIRGDYEEADKVEGEFNQAPCPGLTPEQQLEREQKAKKELEILEGLFCDDETASMVVMAWSDGYKKDQILEEFGYTSTEYESAVKKIRRRTMKFNSEVSKQ